MNEHGTFCTVVNCMDGRIQIPVNDFLRKKCKADFVDTITEAGPIRFLSKKNKSCEYKNILKRIDVSINKHGSKSLAVVAHQGCAGNDIKDKKQIKQIHKSIKNLKRKYPKIELLGLWVHQDEENAEWIVEEVAK